MCKSNQNLRGGRYRLLNGTDENHTVELSTFSNNLHEAICYSQELTKKIYATFSVRSCPGKEFYGGPWSTLLWLHERLCAGWSSSVPYFLPMLENENFK